MPSIDPKYALDEVPCDFALHLSQHLGLDRAAAERVLGEWIECYDPLSRRPISVERGTLGELSSIFTVKEPRDD